MALVELFHSSTKFAEIDTPTGSVTLNTKDKEVTDYIRVKANMPTTKAVQANSSMGRVTGTSYTSCASITVAKTGTYNVSWMHFAGAGGSSSTNNSTRYYIGNTATGAVHYAPIYSNSSASGFIVEEEDVSLTEGQTISVRARSSSTSSSTYIVAGMLSIEEV